MNVMFLILSIIGLIVCGFIMFNIFLEELKKRKFEIGTFFVGVSIVVAIIFYCIANYNSESAREKRLQECFSRSMFALSVVYGDRWEFKNMGAWEVGDKCKEYDGNTDLTLRYFDNKFR